jgi:hypothetical protein
MSIWIRLLLLSVALWLLDHVGAWAAVTLAAVVVAVDFRHEWQRQR